MASDNSTCSIRRRHEVAPTGSNGEPGCAPRCIGGDVSARPSRRSLRKDARARCSPLTPTKREIRASSATFGPDLRVAAPNFTADTTAARPTSNRARAVFFPDARPRRRCAGRHPVRCRGLADVFRFRDGPRNSSAAQSHIALPTTLVTRVRGTAACGPVTFLIRTRPWLPSRRPLLGVRTTPHGRLSLTLAARSEEHRRSVSTYFSCCRASSRTSRRLVQLNIQMATLRSGSLGRREDAIGRRAASVQEFRR